MPIESGSKPFGETAVPLKKKIPATIFKSFISALDARSAPNYDTSSRRGLEVEAAAGCDVGS